MSEQKQGLPTSPILRISQKEFSKMVESGEAQVITTERQVKEADLIHKEENAWEKFFGFGIKVPKPPHELFDTLHRANNKGITNFEPHYLPPIILSNKQIVGSGWRMPPEENFWKSIGKDIDSHATYLPGKEIKEKWICIDTTERPNYKDGFQMYIDDPLKELLTKLRKENNSFYQVDTIPKGSRFGISCYDMQTLFLPELAKILEVPENSVSLPKFIQFNVLGNMHHPEWGKVSTAEFLSDTFGTIGELISGDIHQSGLAECKSLVSSVPFLSVGFRPMITFPSQ